MTKSLLLVLLLSGCGPAPRCVVAGGVEIHGGTFECAEVEAGIYVALAELSGVLDAELPRGSITFRNELFWTHEGETVNGLGWCFPFVMELGSAEMFTPGQALPHELAHWLVGVQTGDRECARGDGAGGHLGWKERGINDAIYRWSP